MADIKDSYRKYYDEIFSKRFNSPYPIRRYIHRSQYQVIAKKVSKDQKILDAGCGDGVLAILLAKAGSRVTACDISKPNIDSARQLATEQGVADRIDFMVADAENLPFADDSFDLVISSHVLEHLPDFDKGLKEIYRVTRKKAIIALPTCLGPCAWSMLGGDNYWKFSKRSLFAPLIGLFRIIFSIFKEGVDEGYTQDKLPHLRRYPWVARKKIKNQGFHITESQAPSLCLPYFNFLLPVSKFLEKYTTKPILRDLGHQILLVVNK